MKWRRNVIITIIIAIALITVFIFIIILNTDRKSGDLFFDSPMPQEPVILTRENISADFENMTLEDFYTVIATVIRNNTALLNTYRPISVELVTGTDTELYKDLCPEGYYGNGNSYEAMMQTHYKKQAAQVTEIVNKYKNGRVQRICIWDYSENMWQNIISDYNEIDKKHIEDVVFLCEIGGVLLDDEFCVNPKRKVYDDFLNRIFDLLSRPEEMKPVNCIPVNEEIQLIGFCDNTTCVTVCNAILWLDKNVGINNRFISFDMSGADISLCVSTDRVGLICLPLAWGKGSMFSFNTGKYNGEMLNRIIGFVDSVWFSKELDIPKLVISAQSNEFNGYEYQTEYLDAKIILNVFQVEENCITIQCKLQGG
ncbi:MAG: hypothetical protein E7385_07770 [Ruminococcaceae bacterium]|nr:hypothetical protein [Oscillospiraceae bacterium]